MNTTTDKSLLQGNILKSLISFAFPVLLALFLQAMYGAADLIIVGQFADTCEQSGVASGSQFFNMITLVITGLTMGVTVFIGDCIGAGKAEKAGQGIGTGIAIFAVLAVLVTVLVVPFSDNLAAFMHAPTEAFAQTSDYVKICGIGTIFITAYNVIGAVFRGIGDSKTPLITVTIACVVNILGDLLLVAGFGMGAVGAAVATVSAQAVSVVFSLYFIRKKNLPFTFSKKCLTGNAGTIFISLYSDGGQQYGRYAICRRRRCRKSLCLFDAGGLCLYAIYFCFCCAEQWCRQI